MMSQQKWTAYKDILKKGHEVIVIKRLTVQSELAQDELNHLGEQQWLQAITINLEKERDWQLLVLG